MISKITYTPNAFSMQNYNSCCGPKKGAAPAFESAKMLKGAKIKSANKNDMTLSHIINNIFEKFSTNKGTYIATSDKGVDIFARETKLGKEASLTLSNGLFEGKSYINFTLKRSINENPKVLSADNDLSEEEAGKYIQTYLGDLK